MRIFVLVSVLLGMMCGCVCGTDAATIDKFRVFDNALLILRKRSKVSQMPQLNEYIKIYEQQESEIRQYVTSLCSGYTSLAPEERAKKRRRILEEIRGNVIRYWCFDFFAPCFFPIVQVLFEVPELFHEELTEFAISVLNAASEQTFAAASEQTFAAASEQPFAMSVLDAVSEQTFAAAPEQTFAAASEQTFTMSVRNAASEQIYEQANLNLGMRLLRAVLSLPREELLAKRHQMFEIIKYFSTVPFSEFKATLPLMNKLVEGGSLFLQQTMECVAFEGARPSNEDKGKAADFVRRHKVVLEKLIEILDGMYCTEEYEEEYEEEPEAETEEHEAEPIDSARAEFSSGNKVSQFFAM